MEERKRRERWMGWEKREYPEKRKDEEMKKWLKTGRKRCIKQGQGAWKEGEEGGVWGQKGGGAWKRAVSCSAGKEKE